MKRSTLSAPAMLAASLLFSTTIASQSAHADSGTTHASDHAPIGVMADHRHAKGEWMLSYRYMFMDMDGNRDGTNGLSPEEVIQAPNPFANPPMMPPNLRVVPVTMPMQMHMVGAMYGWTDRVTLLAMGMFVDKEMDHITFQGPMGTTRLGEFTTESSGIGDTSVGAIFGLDDGSRAHTQLNLSFVVSLPTGSIEETDQILTPMGTTPTPRLPYAMQLGSGTFDLKPSVTGFTRFGDWSIGGQAMGIVRTGENDEGYTLGDVVEASAWTSYSFSPGLSVSGRLNAKSVGQIDGFDPLIMAPVQTADPGNYGGETAEILAGINWAGQSGVLKGHRLAAEIGVPLYRDLNGPQLETDLVVTIGWQKAF
ncbi:MAG: transporter [Pseudomonadota bacterium]